MEVSVASHAIDFRGHEACVVIAEDVTEKERLRVTSSSSRSGSRASASSPAASRTTSTTCSR